MIDTRHLGVCIPHNARFEPGGDCPQCAAAVERINAGLCPHRWPNGEPMACSDIEAELDGGEAEAVGLDPTGRDGDEHFPWKVGHLSTRQLAVLWAYRTFDVCICGHPGYDGHDMRQTPPACLWCNCGWDGRS